jgi:hypothetical protein
VPAADPADHQTGQQARTLARCPDTLGPRPVGGHPRQIALIALHRDVRRQRTLDTHQPLLGIQAAHPAGMLAPGQVPGRLGTAASIGVDPGIGRIAQHVDQTLLVRRPPNQLALARPRAFPHPDPHPVLHQEAQHRMHRPDLFEQIEHQADDRLNLLVRVEADLAAGAAHLPGRPRDRQLPAGGLGQPPGRHPLLDQMQLDLGHGALQSEQ